jgi:hypothetical protein
MLNFVDLLTFVTSVSNLLVREGKEIGQGCLPARLNYFLKG